MSNPTFSTGDLTRKAGAPVTKFHLVKTVAGAVQHNDATAFPYGVVTESAAPATEGEPNVLTHGLPEIVRVQTSQRVVKIATADAFAVDVPVYAAADGAVAATGTVQVGISAEASEGGLVRVHLFHPSIYSAVAGV